MPISREPQVSDLGVCDRETANLGLAQQSPRRVERLSRSWPLSFFPSPGLSSSRLMSSRVFCDSAGGNPSRSFALAVSLGTI